MIMLGSRRFVLSLIGLGGLIYLGPIRTRQVGLHIATLVIGVAAANAYQELRDHNEI